MTKRLRVVGLIASLALLVSVLAGTGAYVIINHINNTDATTETSYVDMDNLFNTDGSINSISAKKLLQAVGYVGRENDTGEYKAHQITTRNTSTNTGTSIIFPMGYVNGTSGDALYWQATFLHNNYLTVWLVKNYKTSTWNASSVTVSYDSYASSTVQSYINGTFYPLVTQNSATLKSIFATPATAGYQALKSGTSNDTTYWYSSSYTSKFDNMSTTVGNSHYMWLPSFGEVFNNTSNSYTNDTSNYTGQWGLNSTDRSFTTPGYDTSATTGYCWLRSGSL